MSNAVATQGFVLEVESAASPSVYTGVGEITSFQGFDGKASEIDVTHLLSTAKEIRPGLQDFGQFSIDCNYIPTDAGQQALLAAKAAALLTHFRATYSNGTVVEFDAYVLSAPVSGGVDAKMDASFTLRITGQPTVVV